jgi:hypothetical protein
MLTEKQSIDLLLPLLTVFALPHKLAQSARWQRTLSYAYAELRKDGGIMSFPIQLGEA